MGAEQLGGILGAVSSSMSGVGAAIGTNAQNEVNFQQAADARTYNTQMSDTAYQRSVQDMTAAGLNPLMMYQTGGGPSSSPTSPTASMQNTMAPIANSSGQIADSIIKGSLAQKQADQMDQQTNNLAVDNTVKHNQAELTEQQANIANYGAQKAQLDYNKTLSTYNSSVAAANSLNNYTAKKAELDANMATFDAYANRAEAGAGAITGAVNSGRSVYNLGTPTNLGGGTPSNVPDNYNINFDTGEMGD